MLIVPMLVVALAGCREDATARRRGADESAHTAATSAQAAQEATLKAGEGSPQRAKKEQEVADDARDTALADRASALAAFRGEQLEYRKRLNSKLAEIDQRGKGTRASHDMRAALLNDLALLDRVTQSGWLDLKNQLGRHLTDVSAFLRAPPPTAP